MFDREGYRYYPSVLVKNKIVDNGSVNGINPCIDFKYGSFKSTVSCGLLKEIIVNPIGIGMEFKLDTNPSPLFFKYTTEFYDLPAIIYGAIAPRWYTMGDYVIRI